MAERNEAAKELARLVLGLEQDEPETRRYQRWSRSTKLIALRKVAVVDWERMRELAEELLVDDGS